MGRSKDYPSHYEVGTLNGKKIYLHPQLGLAIERGDRLGGMAPKELEAWFRQERKDAKMLAALDAEEKLTEIGHRKAYGWPNVPLTVRRDNA